MLTVKARPYDWFTIDISVSFHFFSYIWSGLELPFEGVIVKNSEPLMQGVYFFPLSSNLT
jgi:hypothetical protein